MLTFLSFGETLFHDGLLSSLIKDFFQNAFENFLLLRFSLEKLFSRHISLHKFFFEFSLLFFKLFCFLVFSLEQILSFLKVNK